MLRKSSFYEDKIWPLWRERFENSETNLIFLPGIMGSQLYDKKSRDIRWIDFGLEIRSLEYEKLTPHGAIDIDEQFIVAQELVNPPGESFDHYDHFLSRIDTSVYCYDWRDSISIEAQRLHLFVQSLAKHSKKEINFVTHSMGGCVLLYFLMSTSKFDDKIGKIIFCAPPFHGALRPIRVIEAGAGTPLDGYPFLVPPSSIRRSVATMPGLFQLVVAPRSAWPTEVQQRNGTKRHLKYPIRTPESLYRTGAWSNTYRLDLRNNLVDGAKQYHLRKWAQIENVVRRIGEKISIIVGLNGQTLYSATRSNSRKWVLHKVSKPTRGQYSNGDGTVLFQSSLLPGLPSNRYWAEISPKYRNFHGELMDRPNVIAGVESILASTDVNGAGLIRYHEFIDDVDWSLESVDSTDPRTTDSLDYTERANLRLATPRQQWQSKLNPGGRDAELYYVTREAALQVLAGGDLHAEADRIGQSPEFLKEHLRTLLMPILYS